MSPTAAAIIVTVVCFVVILWVIYKASGDVTSHPWEQNEEEYEIYKERARQIRDGWL